MNTVEDRLRDAYRAAANTVNPDSVPGLGDQVIGVARRPRSRRLQFALPAVAAAATCALIVATTTLVPHAAARHTTRVPARSAASARPADSASALPPFIVVSQGDSLMVYDTLSGVVAGTMNAPSGQQFDEVAPDGNDRTFLVATGLDSLSDSCSATFYRLQLTAGGQPLTLTQLRTMTGYTPTAVAADGGTFAYSVAHCATGSGHQSSNTVIGYIGAGSRRWTFTLSEDYANNLAVSASAGKLAFPMFIPGGGLDQAGLVLDTGSRSGTVAGASRVTLRSHGGVQSVAISANGATLYACSSQGTTMTIAAYDTATGMRTRVLRDWAVSQKSVIICDLSTDASGGYLLASVTNTDPAQDTSPAQSGTTLTGYRLGSTKTVTLPLQLASVSGWGSIAW